MYKPDIIIAFDYVHCVGRSLLRHYLHAMASPQRAQRDEVACEVDTSLPPLLLNMSPKNPTVLEERRSDSGSSDFRNAPQSIPPSTPQRDSVQSAPTILPSIEQHDVEMPVWNKRQIHRWRSPFLMVLFFMLGAAVSVAHCVLYSLLNGKIVGNSDQQEEKLR